MRFIAFILFILIFAVIGGGIFLTVSNIAPLGKTVEIDVPYVPSQ